MHAYLNIAVKAARIAGKVIIDAMLHPSRSIDPKKRSEEVIVNTILRAYPNHNIKSSGTDLSKNAEITWLIDPLNGMINFVQGVPLFGISIAILEGENIEHAVIYNPSLDELFVASKGNGARLNNKKIRCSINSSWQESLVAINLHLLLKDLGYHKKLLQEINYRYMGSSSLHLAFVAAGRLEGYCDYDLDPIEMAAGVLLIKESGGYVTDFKGKLDYLGNGNVIAANTKIHSKLLELNFSPDFVTFL